MAFLFNLSAQSSSQPESLQHQTDSSAWKLQLKEINVVARKKLFVRKNDRLIFHVENTIINSGSNAYEALRMTPGVHVQDDQISMTAKSDITITINNRIIPLSGESLSAYLKGIPTSTIKYIEVISAPSSQYDAEGNSGIINIVLKTSINNSWNLNLRGTYTQATYPQGNAGVDFNFKHNKLSLFSSFTSDYKQSIYKMKNSIFYDEETWILTAPFIGNSNFINGNAGIDYEINDRWTVGAMYFGNQSGNIRKNNQISTNVYNPDDNLKEHMLTVRNTGKRNNLNAINLHSITNIDTLGKKISADIDYFTYNSFDSINNYGNTFDANNTLMSDSYYANINCNHGKVSNLSAKIHVDLPMKWINLNFGGKVSFSENNNDYIFYDNSTGNLVVDVSQTNTFNYKEKILAAYGTATKQITKKLDTQIGFRCEHTTTEGFSQTLNQTTINRYFRIFPSCYLNYQLNDEMSAGLNYSRRINRPDFMTLNPFKSYFNTYDYNEGNPFLKPSYADNTELALNTSNFEHKLWYTHVSGDYFSFPFVDTDTKIVRHYPLNCVNYFSTGISEAWLFDKVEWWNSYNNVVVYYMQKKATIAEAQPALEIVSGKLYTNNDFALNKKKTLMLNLGFFYEFPYLAAYNRIEAMCILNAGIKLLLFNDNMSISLTSNDILRTNHAKSSVISNNIRYIFDNYGDTQNIRLFVSYKFGNRNLRTIKHNISNTEEQERTK
jgi:hypothetical protein